MPESTDDRRHHEEQDRKETRARSHRPARFASGADNGGASQSNGPAAPRPTKSGRGELREGETRQPAPSRPHLIAQEPLEKAMPDGLDELMQTIGRTFVGQMVASMVPGLTEEVVEIAEAQRITDSRLGLTAAESREKHRVAKVWPSASRRCTRQ